MDYGMNYEGVLADRTGQMGVNAIREILKVAAEPNIVSLAGGLPAPESFPTEIMVELTAKVLEKHGPQALQYGPTEGFGPLRQVLADYLKKRCPGVSAEEIIVASGSQGILDAVGKALISRGDPVAVEGPTYVGALQAFTPYQPRYVRLECDNQGLVPESLEDLLEREKPKFVYLNPNFQNPTGRTIPLGRRERIADIIKARQALVVEDDPYGLLRYEGQDLPTLWSLAPENVIYVGTLSKVFAPGLRLGFCVAPELLRRWLVLVKQGVDLHTSTFNQALAAEYIAGGHLEKRLPKIIDLYRPRLKAMLRALADHLPRGFKWSRPEGGMFVWLEGPPGLDAARALPASLAKGVAYVPGEHFYAWPGEGPGSMRLNFTGSSPEQIQRAIGTLAGVLEA